MEFFLRQLRVGIIYSFSLKINICKANGTMRWRCEELTVTVATATVSRTVGVLITDTIVSSYTIWIVLIIWNW